MARRKEIIPSATDFTAFLPNPPLFHADLLKIQAGAELRVPGRWQRYVNNVPVPNLLEGWRVRIAPRFPRVLTLAEFASLEAVLLNYLQGRTGRINPITWEELIGRLQRLKEKSRALLDELNDQAPAYTIAWLEISRASERNGAPTLDRDDIYPLVSRLTAASFHALERAKQNRQAGQSGHHREPWIRLIDGLRGSFENTGGRATAAKNLRGGAYARPSPFVKLVLDGDV